MKDCVGVLGRVFGHKFYARYNSYKQETEWFKTMAAKDPFTASTTLMGFGSEIPYNRRSEYVGEVCVRCGTMVLAEQKIPADEISR